MPPRVPLLLLLVISCSCRSSARDHEKTDIDSDQPVSRPYATAQTAPVRHGGDAADDPAIWIHPTDPAKSLILGTDKQGPLVVYDIDGRVLQTVSESCKPDNVDVLYDVPLAGARTDLAVAACRNPKSLGLKFWRIDPDTRALADVTPANVIPVFGNTEPYGTGVYHSRKSGKHYVFVNNKKGQQEQYELTDAGNSKVGATLVRKFKLDSTTEGCVADDDLGFVYIAEESKGIWKFPAEPDATDTGRLIARVGQHGLKADVEGLAIYYAPGGKGYLIASSQGNSTFKVYTRDGDNTFVGTIDPQASKDIDDVSDTDGIAVTNRPTSATFNQGLFIVQDGANKKGNQNFKLYRWQDIAADRLTVDTTVDPRKP
jgi:3-phytase